LSRAFRALNLAQYFNYSLDLEGARVECGLFKGFSALLMAQIHRLHDPEFRGKDFHLIDNFEGLSELTPADAIGTRDTGNSEQQLIFGYEKAFFSTPLESLLDNLVAKLRCIPVPDHTAKILFITFCCC
jgi:hypothetical protein